MKAFFDLSIFFSNMYYVYILKSEKSGIYYTGIAIDINLRLKDHNRGKSKFTKGKQYLRNKRPCTKSEEICKNRTKNP